MYTFSSKSLRKLEGVHPMLVAISKRAISLSEVDFGISEGLRTMERQKELVASGASQTLQSKHIHGQAVDVFAWVDSGVTWELQYYDLIAEAFQKATLEYKSKVRWGAAWHIPNIATTPLIGVDMRDSYIDLRKSQGRKPFVDAAHFELNT